MPDVITRIDMYHLPDGTIRVFKYAQGWENNTHTHPCANYISQTPIDDMLAWLRSHGWTVRTWPEDIWLAGARAWKGDPLPVHTRSEIIKRRNKTRLRYGYTTDGLDLAFDT